MNKNAIQKFAIWARNELIAQVSQRAYQYGIDESGFGDASADTLNGRLLTAEEKSQRQELIKQIKEKGSISRVYILPKSPGISTPTSSAWVCSAE